MMDTKDKMMDTVEYNLEKMVDWIGLDIVAQKFNMYSHPRLWKAMHYLDYSPASFFKPMGVLALMFGIGVIPYSPLVGISIAGAGLLMGLGSIGYERIIRAMFKRNLLKRRPRLRRGDLKSGEHNGGSYEDDNNVLFRIRKDDKTGLKHDILILWTPGIVSEFDSIREKTREKILRLVGTPIKIPNTLFVWNFPNGRSLGSSVIMLADDEYDTEYMKYLDRGYASKVNEIMISYVPCSVGIQYSNNNLIEDMMRTIELKDEEGSAQELIDRIIIKRKSMHDLYNQVREYSESIGYDDHNLLDGIDSSIKTIEESIRAILGNPKIFNR